MAAHCAAEQVPRRWRIGQHAIRLGKEVHAMEELIKKLEQKIQALVAQRNQLLEELKLLKDAKGGFDAEAQQLRHSLEAAQSENEALAKERDEAAQQLESIVRRLEAILAQLEQQEELHDQGGLFEPER
jgi:FtsZ-binding cell division protein ZapB